MATRPLARCDVASPDSAPVLRRSCLDWRSPLGDVAGGALRVVVEVFDDAPLDVVLARARRGATAAGATRGCSTRRALRHQPQPDQRRIWRRLAVDGARRGLLYCERRGSSRPLASQAVPGSDLWLARARCRQRRAPRGRDRSAVMSLVAVTRDYPVRLPADTVAPERPAAAPRRFAAREATQEQFRLRCADVHPVGCDVELVSSSRDDVVSRACSHGASAHGFTPVWYSSGRLAAIAAEVAQTGRVRAGGARP